MNIAFWFIVIIAAVLLWLALVALYRPLGKLIGKLFNNYNYIINHEDEDNIIESNKAKETKEN